MTYTTNAVVDPKAGSFKVHCLQDVNGFVKDFVVAYKENPLNDDDEARKKEFERITAAMSKSYDKAFLGNFNSAMTGTNHTIPNGDG